MDTELGYNEEEIKMVKETKKIWKVGDCGGGCWAGSAWGLKDGARGLEWSRRPRRSGRWVGSGAKGPGGRGENDEPGGALMAEGAPGPGAEAHAARPSISHHIPPPQPSTPTPHSQTPTPHTPAPPPPPPPQTDDVKITATCVRVPVMRAHAESINLEFDKPISEAEAKAALSKAPGVSIIDDRANNRFPMPLDATTKDDVYVGRIRRDISRDDAKGLELFVCGDQVGGASGGEDGGGREAGGGGGVDGGSRTRRQQPLGRRLPPR
jgi:hypothetical protein